MDRKNAKVASAIDNLITAYFTVHSQAHGTSCGFDVMKLLEERRKELYEALEKV
jgi:hypothetical protein